MGTKHLFVLIYIRNEGEVGTIKQVCALQHVQYTYMLLDVPRRCFFCGPYLLFIFPVCHAFLYVHCSVVVTCWERANLLALLYVMFSCGFVTCPCGVLGQVWYLIVSIPDLCLLTYFELNLLCSFIVLSRL